MASAKGINASQVANVVKHGATGVTVASTVLRADEREAGRDLGESIAVRRRSAGMDVADIGEFGLIRRIASAFEDQPLAGSTGIGDDCAVIPCSETLSHLVTTDLLVEDIHFLRNKIHPRDLGYKSLAVNLSDIAAMGGKPSAAFLSIAAPRDLPVSWLDDFVEGLRALAFESGTSLLGGDTTRSKDRLLISLTALGTAPPQQIKYRSTARQGDIVCVTGTLGDSAGGLRLILDELDNDPSPEAQTLLNSHYRPSPHLAEGRWLAAQAAIHAMMDVSDGVNSDIRRLMEQSGVGAEISTEQIPLSSALEALAHRQGWDAVQLALCGGEDYCILCTVEEHDSADVQNAFQREFGRPLFRIGRITDGDRLTYAGRPAGIALPQQGWDHFKRPG